MQNLKTKTLLNIVSGLGNLGMLLLAAIALFQVSLLSNFSDHALLQSGKINLATVSVESATVEFKRQVQEWKDILLRGNDSEKFDKYLGNFAQRESKMDEHLQTAATIFGELGEPSKVQKIQEIIRLHQALGGTYREALKSYVKSDPLAYRTVDNLVAGVDRPLTEELSGLVTEVENECANGIHASGVVIQEKRRMAIIYFGVFLALSSILVYVSGHKVASLVYQRLGGEPLLAAEVAHAVARGDLTVAIPSAHAESLMGAMGKMKNDLKVTIGAFASGVEKTQDSSADLSSVASAIKDNTSAQANATASIAATTEEIAACLKSLSLSANSAHDLSHQSGQEASQGGTLIKNVAADVMALADHAQEVSSVVSELELHQQNVSNIVKVIAGIADQTNLLALNAAIEAARAGEQGRGFAVVADEVRKLAERTTQSTREIRITIDSMHGGTSAATDKINQMLVSVKESVERANVAEQAIVHIIEMTGRTDYAVKDITNALNEQSQAVDDIAKKIEEVAETSDANLSNATQLTDNAAKLNLVSGELLSQIKRFKLQENSGGELF